MNDKPSACDLADAHFDGCGCPTVADYAADPAWCGECFEMVDACSCNVEPEAPRYAFMSADDRAARDAAYGIERASWQRYRARERANRRYGVQSPSEAQFR